MEETEQKHILVLITNPFAMLNVIHSGLMRELGKYYRISVMSDLLTADDITHLNKHLQTNMHWTGTSFPKISRLSKWLRTIQMLLFGYYFGLETIRIKLLERNPAFHWLFCTSRKCGTLLDLGGALMVQIRNWLIRYTASPEFHALVSENRFQAVISSSPLDLRENAVANSLHMHGIPCISIIISWDNLTSKGVSNAKAALVLVWNKRMALEYERFYAVFGDKALIGITGIQRFDVYFRDQGNRSHILPQKPGISPHGRIILFSTGAIRHHSCQNYIIDDLLAYVQKRPCTAILVRCHPGDDFKRYSRFKGTPNLHFFRPFGENARPVPPVDFLETLHSQLAGCSVCVQIASTMQLDASACNIPCISIAYDAREDVHYADSVRRFYDYSHQLPLPIQLKERVVCSRQELFRNLDEVFSGDDMSTDLRAVMQPVTHHCAPYAVSLTTQHIRGWLG